MATDVSDVKRREFLLFMGGATLSALVPVGCVSVGSSTSAEGLPFRELKPNFDDKLTTINGLKYSVLIQEGQLIHSSGLKFGSNNDYIAIVPTEEPEQFFLVVNHESVHPMLNFGNELLSREPKWIDEEMKAVGVSILRIRKEGTQYEVLENHPSNRRIDANTPIPLVASRPIEGSKIARGTLANCAGGITSWGTTLTCEENYGDFVGDRPRGRRTVRQAKNQFQWFTVYEMPPEHYGWVVEVDPKTGSAKKLTSLGRMVHEGATVTKAKNGVAVVYMGDDDNDRCLYKFISESAASLEKGTLYVANVEAGEWIPLDWSKNKEFKKTFKDQTELLIYAREAALMVGGTKLDRPEDIEIDPLTSNVFISLTNNAPKGRPHGTILKLIEEGNDHGALKFKSSTFILGGTESGFSSPDNLAIDRNGNLWMTNDVSGSNIGTPDYAFSGNNSLFFIPLSGQWAGRSFRVATAPKDAEFTGPQFSPDGKSLFLSVQHPGETSRSLAELSSHWPQGGSSIPRSAIVVLEGKMMDFLLGDQFKRA